MPRHPKDPLNLRRSRRARGSTGDPDCHCRDCSRMIIDRSIRPAEMPCELCGEMSKYRPQRIALAATLLADGLRNICWCCCNSLNAHVYYQWGLCWADPMARYAILEWHLDRFNNLLRKKDPVWSLRSIKIEYGEELFHYWQRMQWLRRASV